MRFRERASGLLEPVVEPLVRWMPATPAMRAAALAAGSRPDALFGRSQRLFYGIAGHYPETVLATPGLVSYYRFEETSGNLVDSGPDNIPLVYSSGSPTYHVAGALTDGSYAFQCPGGFTLYTRSIGSIPVGQAARSFVWWHKSSNSAGQNIFSYGSEGVQFHKWVTIVYGGTIGVETWADDRSLSASPSPTNGNWHHIGLTKAASPKDQIKVYYDGSLLGTMTYGGGTSSINTDSTTFNMFRDPIHATLDGYLDEFTIWNVELSATTIAALYAAA